MPWKALLIAAAFLLIFLGLMSLFSDAPEPPVGDPVVDVIDPRPGIVPPLNMQIEHAEAAGFRVDDRPEPDVIVNDLGALDAAIGVVEGVEEDERRVMVIEYFPEGARRPDSPTLSWNVLERNLAEVGGCRHGNLALLPNDGEDPGPLCEWLETVSDQPAVQERRGEPGENGPGNPRQDAPGSSRPDPRANPWQDAPHDPGRSDPRPTDPPGAKGRVIEAAAGSLHPGARNRP